VLTDKPEEVWGNVGLNVLQQVGWRLGEAWGITQSKGLGGSNEGCAWWASGAQAKRLPECVNPYVGAAPVDVAVMPRHGGER
jgi:hypothetical protein